MKTKTMLVFGALSALTSLASAQTTIINISGATAFRAAAHDAIVASLGGPGVAQYGYTASTLAGSNEAIFKGTIGGNAYIIRTRFSGSLAGIADVATATSITNFITSGTTVPVGGTQLVGATTESAVPRWAFSDVDKALSNHPNANLGGGAVGIVPFMFIAGKGAPAGITNMTDQNHNTLWSRGDLNASFFTGQTSSITILATGRNASSGTRATILSETGFGSFNPIKQYNVNLTNGNISLFGGTPAGNEGHTGNGAVANALNFASSGLVPANTAFIGYLTVSDAISITGYDPATGNYSAIASPGQHPVPLTYNGVRYSVANVRNGSYTLWGYQQLYTAPGLSSTEQAFDTLLRNTIPTTLQETTGIANDTNMRVIRTGGDGGPILPK